MTVLSYGEISYLPNSLFDQHNKMNLFHFSRYTQNTHFFRDLPVRRTGRAKPAVLIARYLFLYILPNVVSIKLKLDQLDYSPASFFDIESQEE